MKYCLLPVIIFFCCGIKPLMAQERVDHNKMNYLYNPKPNAVIYNDTLYKGSTQFRQLFYKTRDMQIIQLYQKHQSNKIWGGLLGTVGAFAAGFGVAYATNSTDNKSAGWITAGSGLACTILGGYLIQSGQKNLVQAVELFNLKYNKTSAGIGFSGNRVGLVLNF